MKFIIKLHKVLKYLLLFSSETISPSISQNCIRTQKTILTFVLYGCKMWSLTLMGEYKLHMFENKISIKYLDLRMME